MPNENNTNQINSNDVGNFPDSALGQENHTHHSPAVREEVANPSAKDDGGYSLDHVLESDIHIGSKLTGIHGGAGVIVNIDPDHNPTPEEMKRRMDLLLATDEVPYSYYYPLKAMGHPPSISSIRYDSSRKAKLRKIRQLKKRVAASSGAKKYLFKELLKIVKRKLNKINNASLSGGYFSTRREKVARKIRRKREREFLLYGIPFPVQKYPAGGMRSSMDVAMLHASLTSQARNMQGIGRVAEPGIIVGDDLAGMQNLRRGLGRMRMAKEASTELARVRQGVLMRGEGVSIEFASPDITGYKQPEFSIRTEENCKGCGDCKNKPQALEMIEAGLNIGLASGQSIADHIGDVSIKDMYPDRLESLNATVKASQLAASAHQVAQSIANKRDDDAAADERFALDA